MSIMQTRVRPSCRDERIDKTGAGVEKLVQRDTLA
jgi:hypothetical protein